MFSTALNCSFPFCPKLCYLDYVALLTHFSHLTKITFGYKTMFSKLLLSLAVRTNLLCKQASCLVNMKEKIKVNYSI